MLTLYVHYRPRREEGAEFKLKLGLPKRKTVAAMMKAFAKAVAKSDRGYGLTIDVAECFVTKMDVPPPAQTGNKGADAAARRAWENALAYVRPETLVGDAFRHKEDVRLVRRDDVPEDEVDETNWGAPRELSFWTITTKG